MRFFTLLIFVVTTIRAFAQTPISIDTEGIKINLTLPTDFTIVDSATAAQANARGVKSMQDASGIAVNDTTAIDLLTASKGLTGQFNIVLSKPAITNRKAWESTNNIIKTMLYKTFTKQFKNATIDSITTADRIDGLLFDKFQMNIKLTTAITMSFFYSSLFYSRHVLSVNYFYIDDGTKEEIENILKNMKIELPTLIGADYFNN